MCAAYSRFPRHSVTNKGETYSSGEVNTPLRQSDAKRSIGNKSSVVKNRRRGRPREGRSMGRYPFLTFAREYLDIAGDLFAPATLKELDRRLRRMARDLEFLREQDAIDTTDPRKMSEKDISGYLGLLRSRGLAESGQAHNLSALRAILLFCGNPILDRMKIRYASMLPRRRSQRYPPMQQSEIEAIYEKASTIDSWDRLRAYAAVVLALNTGLRNKELRLARIGDLDMNNWGMTVRHPKGEGKYGHERRVIILPPARPILLRYLRARDEEVSRSKNPLNDALFPALAGGNCFLSSDKFCGLKRKVEAETGIRFDFRACRRTFGQNCVDQGIQIETVSLVMGHHSTKTTESYYCRKREDTALREIEAFCRDKPARSAIKPLIENEKYMSGYA